MNKWVVYGLIFLGGVMLADKARSLPVIKSLPRI